MYNSRIPQEAVAADATAPKLPEMVNLKVLAVKGVVKETLVYLSLLDPPQMFEDEEWS